MEVRGIITGDIVKSNAIQPDKRTVLLDAKHILTEELKTFSVLQMDLIKSFY